MGTKTQKSIKTISLCTQVVSTVNDTWNRPLTRESSVKKVLGFQSLWLINKHSNPTKKLVLFLSYMRHITWISSPLSFSYNWACSQSKFNRRFQKQCSISCHPLQPVLLLLLLLLSHTEETSHLWTEMRMRAVGKRAHWRKAVNTGKKAIYKFYFKFWFRGTNATYKNKKCNACTSGLSWDFKGNEQ